MTKWIASPAEEHRPMSDHAQFGPSPSAPHRAHVPPAHGAGSHGTAMGNMLRETREAWPGLSTYERFEQVVSLVLTALIGLVIIAAVINLTFRVVTLVVFGMLDPAEHGVFQAIF